MSCADGVRCTQADGVLLIVCECRPDFVLRGRRTRGCPGRHPLVNHPALLDRTFGFIKYGTTTHSFLDFVTANCQFRISANRGRMGDGILLTEVRLIPAVSLYLRNPYTDRTVSMVV